MNGRRERRLGGPAEPTLRVAGWIARSRANGPGERFVLWLQGCSLRCPGCWNPDTWPRDGGRRVTVAALLARVAEARRGSEDLDGISLTGGEPFDQAGPLLAFVDPLRRAGLGVVAFSGYTLDELRGRGPRAAPPGAAELLARVDLLVAGPYRRRRRVEGLPLLGSANQRLHFLTERHHPADLADLPELEFHLDPAGGRLTGFPADPAAWLG